MSNTVIRVEDLSKRYRLGLKEKQADTLAGQVANLIKSPWQNLKRLRALNKFGVEDESVFWALKDINFEVMEGEVLGIIGKNGAGKSTLLKILSQITDPTSGKIEIRGRVASLLEVGTGFHPELSGRENIYMNGTILGMTRKEIDSKLDEIIDFSGVEKFIDTPVKFYSSGMKVRLGFSVAAHLEPEILIIDEVLAVGDYEFQKKCLGKMEDVAGQGRTVLFVSHNMGAIQNLTKNSILLESGKIKLRDSTRNVVDAYISLGFNYSVKNIEGESFFSKVIPLYLANDTAFRFNSELKFLIYFDQIKPLPSNFRIGFTISSIDDINIISGISNYLERDQNEMKYELTIKNSGLVEGNYKLSLSVGIGSLFEARKELEVCRDVSIFSIINSQVGGLSLFNWHKSYGMAVKNENDVTLTYRENNK
ncbi:ABC transporter ATP-binding protein [Algoriphagus machipongonensis]|uniref:ABC transporter, ATP-binding protein n=1 Tax=Algoriphagus machipongonensis TaxID=388413 RepID=A3HRH9_9BACT|nr:ABC transporter ATP-binding protein [Algoriphagus machipongonensis]EAZ82447.1 ABC transporter, ATP-binding protein [Algoriphagus machipongonensis]